MKSDFSTKHDLSALHSSYLDSKSDMASRFYSLSTTWRTEIESASTANDMFLHPAYQQIIGMGPSAIPFLLRELSERPEHWFWALTAFTGVDPVPESHRGRVDQMAQAWLQWRRERGYV